MAVQLGMGFRARAAGAAGRVGFAAGMAVAAPMAAVGLTAAIALGVLCTKTAETYKDLGCTITETRSWICHPIVAAAMGQCIGALAATVGTGFMFVMPFYSVMPFHAEDAYEEL